MSLLLKALKQAESANADRADALHRPDGDLELEPLAGPASVQQREWVEPPGLLFGSSGLSPEPQPRAGFTWPRLSLVPVAAGVAALIALGYGVYLYFALQPPPAATLPPAASAGAVAVPPPAPVAPVAVETVPAALPATAPAPAAPPAARPEVAPQAAAPARAAPRPAAAAAAPAPAAPQFQPDPQSTLLGEAYAAWQRGELDTARQLYGRSLARGRSVDALLGLAAIASVEDREADAQRFYREVLEIDPHHAAAQAALLDLVGSTDGPAAESRLKTLIARDPSPQLYQTLGNLYAGQGRWGDAQAAYFEAYRGAPDNADYAFNLAVALDQLQQVPAARTYYEKALASDGVHRFDRAQAAARLQQLAPPR